MKYMKLGDFELTIVSDGTFWLDGGAMFGVVPKALWNRLNPADELNRIRLSLSCLLIKTPEHVVIVDTGIGGDFKERFLDLYGVERGDGLPGALHELGIAPEDIDYVINTHLHFDHCGGNTKKHGKTFIPTFSRARYIIQELEWDDAHHTNERTKASYMKRHFEPIEAASQLMLVDGDHEVIPGITVRHTNGHTRGHQSVLIESGGKKAMYLGDLIPTTAHIKIPYIMGYDLFPVDILKKKKEILDMAAREHWLLIFEHDPRVSFGYVQEQNGQMVFQRAD
ncbi:MAG: MBL fold metallo-hydrolase [candidate division WOR-3 bacterium]|nr:MAG: MBL fold metallo-hydrolase [candidate division WOR-3 bacterium]